MKLVELKKNKGQAAITDALFFLTIIVALSVLLFKFSASYGERIDVATSNLYFKEYTNSALKTIFYSEIPLSFDKEITNNTEEIDYLMTAIKSDYFSDKKIGFSEINQMSNPDDTSKPLFDADIPKFQLYNTIKAVMHPMPNYDYLFYLNNTTDSKFELFIIKVTDFEIEKPPGIEGAKKQVNVKATGVFKYYLCDPNSFDNIRDMMSNVNDVFSSSTPLQFTVDPDQHPKDNINFVSTFATWPATATITDNYLIDNLNCVLYEDI